MKRNQIISYAVLVAVVVGAAIVAIVIAGRVGDSKKAKPLTATQKAGVALTADFNKMEASAGLKIARIVKCAQDPQNAVRFECLAVVTKGTQKACGDFVFKMSNAVVKPEAVQAVDPQNCQ